MARDRGFWVGVLSVVVAWTVALGTAGCRAQGEPAAEVADAAGNAADVRLTGRLSADRYAPGEDIEVTAVVTNGGSAPLTLDEGCFRAVFVVGGELKTFLQIVRASFASGVGEVIVDPGGVHEETFVIQMKNRRGQVGLPAGQYPMRICYHGHDRSWRPSADREAARIVDGVLVRLDAEEIVVRIE